MIWYVSIVRKILNHPHVYWILTIIAIPLAYFICVFYSYISTGILSKNDFENALHIIPSILILVPLVIFGILLFYEWKFENNIKIEKFSSTVTILLAIVIVVGGLSGSSQFSNFTNRLNDDRFYDNVKGAIFVYPNEYNNSRQDITFIICNHQDTDIITDVEIYLSFEDEYKLNVNERSDGWWDISPNLIPVETNIEGGNINNTMFIRNQSRKITLKSGSMLFMKLNVTGQYLTSLENYGVEFIGKPGVFIAHFNESQKYLLDGSHDLDTIFDKIVEYENNNHTDWMLASD